jgi:thiosulfate reductase/polysulfide reductase chain A
MSQITRRNFMKFAVASGAVMAAGEAFESQALAGTIQTQTGRDFSPKTGKERKAIPSACWQCVSRDSLIGFVEDGRIVKLEGQPKSIRGEGYICARGQGGLTSVYDPDRILHPMKRTGPRGSGKWKRISWDDAIGEVIRRLKKIRDAGTPEKFLFHYGRAKASSSKVVVGLAKATGTKSVGNHTGVCESAKWSAQELTWGGHFDNWDIDNTKYILNFGSNILETHTNHISVAHRIMRAKVDRGVKLVTFDVRMSNTAAKSNEWIPTKQGTDIAIMLAMTNVVLNKGLYKGAGEEFLRFCKCTENHEDPVEAKIAALKKHYANYTPEWASKLSGVPASKIEQIATEFATTKPAVLIAYRGPLTTYNGCDAERARQVLSSITGNVDAPGTNCKAVGASWKGIKVPGPDIKAKGLDIFNGWPKGHNEHYPYPTHHASHQVLPRIKAAGPGLIEVAMWYCYSPFFINGNHAENIAIAKDEKLLPFVVSADTSYGDSTHYADLILPDATYLERYDWEDMVDPTQTGEYYIRQALVKPLGEARDTGDVMIDICKGLGIKVDFNTKEEYVKRSVDQTPGVKEAGGWEYMAKHGVWNGGKTHYFSYKEVILDPKKQVCKVGGSVYEDLSDPEAICPYFGDDVLYDKKAGVWWHWKASKAKSKDEAVKKGYYKTKGAYKGYVGTKVGHIVYRGFAPDKVNKSGYMELWSQALVDKGYNALPEWHPAPNQKNMGPDDMHLTTYKVCVQTHSRTQNNKWLTEIYPNNHAWINPVDAGKRGIKDGDRIKVKSSIGEMESFAHVTENAQPRHIHISHHMGHWQYGRYASGNRSPVGVDDPDDKNIHWKWHGSHPNQIIPCRGDRIAGFMRWNDTVVQVRKA